MTLVITRRFASAQSDRADERRHRSRQNPRRRAAPWRLGSRSYPEHSRAAAAPGQSYNRGMSAIPLTVNGRALTVDVDPATPLLYVLSDDLATAWAEVRLRSRSVRRLHRHRARRRDTVVRHAGVGACRAPRSPRLEGLARPEQPHPIQQAFIAEQAAQCGFCLNGVILTAKAFLDRNPKAGRRRDAAGAVGRTLPLLHPHADAACHQALRAGKTA